MKKSLVVVALAGAMAFTAASAETVLYGSIRLGAEVGKNHYNAEVGKNHYNAEGVKNKRGLEMADYGSRLGIKGSEDLGNGAKVLYQVEFGFDGMTGGKAPGSDFETRLAWIGVTGEWGTIALGRQNNPFTESLNADTEADQFNGDLGSVSALRYATGSVLSAATTNRVADSNGNPAFGSMPTRVGNSIAYVSPSFSGFNFVVAGIAEAPADDLTGAAAYNARNNSSKGFDMYTVGLNYEHESGFYAKAAYLGADLQENFKRANVYGLNVGFANEQFGVNADFGAGERGQKNGGNKVTSTGWDLGGHFSFGPDYFSTIRATVGQAEVKYKNQANPTKDTMTVWAVGFEQKLSTRTKVWVEYGKENRKYNKSTAIQTKENRDAVSVGIRHDF